MEGTITILDDAFDPRAHSVERLISTITEVIARAPYAASDFQPWQFFRLCTNYETYTTKSGRLSARDGRYRAYRCVGGRSDGLLNMTDRNGRFFQFVRIFETGRTRCCDGTLPARRSEIPKNETVPLAGGGLGNAVLFSIAKALKQNNNNVIYFAGYKKGEDLYKQDEVEEGTDQVIWSTDTGAAIMPRRKQDSHIRANIVQAMLAYQNGELGERMFPLESVSRIIAIGSDRMMAAVKEARHTVPCAAPARPRRYRQHQLHHAVHDERGLRAMPSAPRRSRDGQGKICVQLLQSGSNHGRSRFSELERTAESQQVQEKLTTLWLGHLLKKASAEHV